MTPAGDLLPVGSLAELVVWAEGDVRGEITLVVAGASAVEVRAGAGLDSAEGWVAAVEELESQGTDRRAAIVAVAKRAGVPRREVYDAVVRARHPAP